MSQAVTSASQAFRAMAHAYWETIASVRVLVAVPLRKVWPGANPLAVNVIFGAIVLLGVFAIGASTDFSIPPDIYRTEVGEFRTVPLPDGSTVQLAPVTELRVQYAKRQRNFTLVQGEAYFTVHPDPARPFRVKARGRIVRAVGTAFNVRSRANTPAEVIVAEGKVTILGPLAVVLGHVPRNAVQLTQGQSMKLPSSAVDSLSEVDIQRKLAWRDGDLIFAGEPLHVVVDEVNLFSRTQLYIDDPSIREVPIGARFKTSATKDLITALTAVNVRQRTETRNGVEEIHLYR